MSPCFPGLVLVFLDSEYGARTSLGTSESEKETSAKGWGPGTEFKRTLCYTTVTMQRH